MIKALILALFTTLVSSAAGVSITTIACTTQVVTVNCTACGITQYQGFSIAGASVSTYNLNSTAGTASANTFTFTLPTGTPCNGSATGGTVTPAKQIINTTSSATATGNITINYLSWYTVIAPVPIVGGMSAWSGASAAENAAIAAGTTIEVPGSITFAASTLSTTLSANLVAQYNAVETSYNSGFLGFAGYWWNGIAWVNH